MQLKADKFTSSGWSSILNAQKLAHEHSQQYIETEHLLLSLIETDEITKELIRSSSSSIVKLKELLIDFINILLLTLFFLRLF